MLLFCNNNYRKSHHFLFRKELFSPGVKESLVSSLCENLGVSTMFLTESSSCFLKTKCQRLKAKNRNNIVWILNTNKSDVKDRNRRNSSIKWFPPATKVDACINAAFPHLSYPPLVPSASLSLSLTFRPTFFEPLSSLLVHHVHKHTPMWDETTYIPLDLKNIHICLSIQ